MLDRHYLMEVSYLGADFFGFQSQPGGNTVQDHLEAALATFLRHPVRIIGSSRTDSGVHAKQQFVLFATAVSFDPAKLALALHALMPRTIGIIGLKPVPASFHPIRSATAKLYSYKLWTSPFRAAQSVPFCWWLKKPLDLTAMRRGAGSLIGRHDFASFCAADSSAKTTVRRLYDIRVQQLGHQTEVWVLGEGFLKQMVRAIVGTLVEQGKHPADRQAPSVATILAAKDRSRAGVTAPAHGLTLERVFFRPVTMISDRMIAPEAQPRL